MKINLARLTTKNLATLAERIINSSLNGNYILIQEHPLFTALQSSYQKYDAVYTKLTFSGKGKEVAQADKARDEAFSSMKAFLNGYRKLSSANYSADAEALYQVFKRYGLDMDRMSYSSQSAQMKKLIEALETTENMQRITNLNITGALQALRTTQIEFEQLFAEQAEANADLRELTSATALRKELERVLRSYIDFITVMKNIPDYTKLYHDLNEIVKAAKNSNVKTNETPTNL